MNRDNILGLETLDAWKSAKEFAVKVCKEILPLLPPEEKWNLSQQIRRSVQSIPANIAEGHGRFYYADTVRFCYIARGSLSEAYTQLTIAHEMGYISENIHKDLRTHMEHLTRVINGYIAYLKRAKIGANEPGADRLFREEASSYTVEYPEAPESMEDH